MLSYGIECFKKLGTSEVAVEEIIEMGSLEDIFNAVKLHLPGNKKIIKQFMDMLDTFAKTPRLARMIGERLGNNWEWLTGAINANKDDSGLMKSIADTVTKLASDPTNTDQMARDGVFDALGIVVETHPKNIEISIGVSGSFIPYTGRCHDYCNNLIHANNSVPLLISAMFNNPDNLSLCTNVSKLIENLALSGKNSIDYLKRDGVNTVDALLLAAEQHPYDDNLINAITGALKLLTGANDMSLCLSVLHGNMALDGKCAAAMSKLAGLLLAPDNVDYLFKNKGVEWLIAILAAANVSKDPNAPKILVSGCLALKRCAIDPNKIYEIIRCKGVPVLISIINDHIDDPAIVAAALGALSKLIGDNKDNAKYLISKGTIPTVLRSIKEHPLNPQVIRPGLDLLNQLAGFNEEDFNSPIRGGGGMALLTKIIEDYQDSNKPIATLALNTLGLLANDDNKVRDLVGDTGFIKNLMKILTNNDDDLDLAKAAALALDRMAQLPDVIPRLLALGAVPGAQACLTNFDDEELHNIISNGLLPKLMNSLKNTQQEEENKRLALLRKQQEEEEKRKALEEKLALEAEMMAALNAMKLQEEEDDRLRRERERKEREWKEEERQRKAKEEEERLKAEAAAKEAAKLKTLQLAQLAIQEKKQIVMTKSAKRIFADDDAKKMLAELSDATKNFLQAGQLLMKHSKTAAPRQRHLYLSPDLTHLNWKDPKGDLKLKNRMKVFKLFLVVKGCTTPQLMRKTLMGKPMAREELSFSIHGSDLDSEQERTVDFEAATERDRDRWFSAIEELIEWAKVKRLWGGDTMAVNEDNKMYAKDKAAHVVI